MMRARGTIRLESLGAVYDRRSNDDVPFATLLEGHEDLTDDELAELIEEDGRQRVMRNREVSIERYAEAVGDLFNRPVPLDAAIDVTLRWMSRAAQTTDASVEQLVAKYPHLAAPIYEAAVLNNALCSTTGIRSKVRQISERRVPCDFGPKMANGLHRYELRKLLGSGAFGEVFEAVDRYLSEDGYEALVAIKILATEGRTRWSRQRLVEEATKARRVEHPNVVRVLDRGVSADDEEFIVYELIEGGDLSTWIRKNRGQIRPLDAARLIARSSRGVQAAHSAGLVHCDLKPGNIILNNNGEPKVADFGIAIRSGESLAELRDGEVDEHPIGNLAFISPEQYRMDDHALTIPSDVYALGGMLFLLLTGELPNGSSIEKIAEVHHPSHGRSSPPSVRAHRPDVDRDLDAICQRAMAVDPSDRYSSAGALADDLEAWIRHEPLLWTRPSMFRIARLWMKRRPAVAAISCLLLVAIIGGGILTNVLHSRAVEARAEAQIEAVRRAEERHRREAIHERVHEVLHELFAEDALPTSGPHMLVMFWVLQYVLGPNEPRYDQAVPQFWLMRFTYVEEIVDQARQDGRYNHLDSLLWRSALAFWLIERGDLEQAREKLPPLREQWETLLHPEDKWIGYLDALYEVSTVKVASKSIDQSMRNPTLHEELETAHEVLAHQEALLREHNPASPLHLLVLDAQYRLYGPTMLDLPEQHDLVQERIEWCRQFHARSSRQQR